MISIGRHIVNLENSVKTTFNSSNEVAIEAFLNGRLKFSDIVQVIDRVCQKIENKKLTSIEEIFEIDEISREMAKNAINFLTI